MTTGKAQPLRLGIVGCGFVTEHRHLPALASVPEIEVWALADLDGARRDAVADRFGVARRHDSVEELLDESAVDAVAVCTGAPAHAPVALAALAAGKHVFVEKPLTLSLPEADALVDAAAEAPGATMVGFNLRWHRSVRAARELLADGRIGRVTAVAGSYTDALVRPELPQWRTRREQGGGALLEKLVHHFDLWHLLLADEVEEVFALSRHETADDQVTVVTARMGGGALVHALASDVTSVGNELVLYGDRGSIRLDLYRFDGLAVSSLRDLPGSPGTRVRGIATTAAQLVRSVPELRRGGLFDATYAAEWREFAAAAREGRPAGTTFDDGRRALRVALAAAASSSAGRPVRVEDAPAEVSAAPAA